MKLKSNALFISLRASLSSDSLRNQQPNPPKFVGKTKVQSHKGQN
jgi:hypothetical protein